MSPLGRARHLSRRNVLRARAPKYSLAGAKAPWRARAAETAQRDCTEAEYGQRDTLSAADSALSDTNAAPSSQPLIHNDIWVCVYGLG